MGQKVNPHGLRVGVIKDWDSRWFANKKEFGTLLLEDHNIRKSLKSKLYTAGISKIEIERAANKIKLNIHVAKPGMVIGRGGAGIEELKSQIEKSTKKNVSINISEIKNPERDAQLIAENIALAIEKRVAFRRAMKQAIQRAMKSGVKGIKVSSSGRLGGAEMARTEGYSEGNVPLQTLRADIAYGFAEANTTYGKTGIKVWVYNGEVLPTRNGATPRVEEVKNNKKDNKKRPERRDNRDNRFAGDRRDNRNNRFSGDNRNNKPSGDNRNTRPQRTEK